MSWAQFFFLAVVIYSAALSHLKGNRLRLAYDGTACFVIGVVLIAIAWWFP